MLLERRESLKEELNEYVDDNNDEYDCQWKGL
jgi:hypothetical protein